MQRNNTMVFLYWALKFAEILGIYISFNPLSVLVKLAIFPVYKWENRLRRNHIVRIFIYVFWCLDKWLLYW